MLRNTLKPDQVNTCGGSVCLHSFYKLVLVTDKNHRSVNEYLHFIKTCAESGITAVQLREKRLSYQALLTFGEQLKLLLDQANLPLIINDSVELALALNASGVHLGQNDGDIHTARQALGPDKIIGVSIDSVENLLVANELPINYVGIGAIFPTKNKKNVSTIWGIDGLRQLIPLSKHPVIAIGGINTRNAKSVIATGVDGIAAIGVFHEASDPHSIITSITRGLAKL